ncbi:MAG: LicD family protein, partial [Christensenella sp.]
MEKLSIDEMKQIELELMSELDRVCRENNLSYVLAYGSCLGAVRHKGFIPWDDDMDVAMPRADYERLIDSFDQLKSKPHYELVSYRKNKAIYPFLKLIDTTTQVLENFADKRFSTGVWVDIFPLDKVDPSDSSLFRRNKHLALVRSLIVADPHVGSSLFVKMVKRLTHPFASRMNPYDYARRIDENAAGASLKGGET